MLIRRICFPVFLASIASLSACAVTPVGPISGPPADEELLSRQALAFIEIGATSKEEIRRTLGRSVLHADEKVRGGHNLARREYHDGDWWLYGQLWRDKPKIIGSPIGEVWRTQDRNIRFALIKFDEQGIVSDYELSTSEDPGCKQNGICVREPFEYVLLASPHDDLLTKQFRSPTGRCGIYVYSEPDQSSLSISIDDRLVGPLINNEHFYYLIVEPGIHQLMTGPWYTSDGEFECASGELYFLDLKVRTNGIFSRPQVDIERADQTTGRNAVANRRLTLREAASADCIGNYC